MKINKKYLELLVCAVVGLAAYFIPYGEFGFEVCLWQKLYLGIIIFAAASCLLRLMPVWIPVVLVVVSIRALFMA